jgi:hypothetical protein
LSLTKKLADKHEDDIHEWLGGHQSKSSGNQWADQGDGRLGRYQSSFGWCWDAKCALPQTKSISVTRDMVDKIIHQSHGDRPLLPLRFYSSERGQVEHDLVVLRMEDFRELLEALEAS